MDLNSVKSTLALHFPHRIFVGSLTRETTPAEIAEFFRNFGVVIESKIILDSAGCSKGFGFVSFDSKEAVQKVLQQGTIYLKGRKITIAPAVKKHNVQDSLPADVKPTKYFTKKGSVKDIGFTNIRWPVTPQPQQPQQQQQQQQHVTAPQVTASHMTQQQLQQQANFMHHQFHTMVPGGSYNYATNNYASVVPQWHIAPNTINPPQGNFLTPYVFIC